MLNLARFGAPNAFASERNGNGSSASRASNRRSFATNRPSG
jgi:hypothetical protein